MRRSQVIPVDVRQQHGINLAEPRVVRAAHREPGVVEDPGAVGVLEDHGPVEGAELAVMAA
ncbi:hypothetical protein D3C83_38320 [compost metagenome]